MFKTITNHFLLSDLAMIQIQLLSPHVKIGSHHNLLEPDWFKIKKYGYKLEINVGFNVVHIVAIAVVLMYCYRWLIWLIYYFDNILVWILVLLFVAIVISVLLCILQTYYNFVSFMILEGPYTKRFLEYTPFFL